VATVTVLVAEEEVALEFESRLPSAASAASVHADRSFVFPGRPAGLVVASDGTSFVSDATSRTIWRVDRSGNRTVAFARAGGLSDAPGTRQPVRSPAGLALAFDGTLVVADSTGHQVWAVSPEGAPRLLAGSVSGYRDGPGGSALFRHPSDVAIGPDGTYYVADAGNHCVRTITSDGVVSTLAGSIYDYGDGRGPGGRFRQPLALDVDADGTCYVADTGNNAVRRIAPDGQVTTVAGSPPGGDADGVGVEVGLRWPTGIAVGHGGHLWVADHGNGAVRRIEQTGVSTTTLRLTGRRWPGAMALTPDGEVVVVAVVLDDVRLPQTCLTTAGVDR